MSKKNLFIVAAIITAFLAGCSEQVSVVDPIEQKSDNWLRLPSKQSLSVETIFSAEKEIIGSQGGIVKLEVQYPGGQFGNVSIVAELDFPPGAFQGTKNIVVNFDDEYVVASFGPPSTFNIPATFNLTVTGLDLNGVSNDELHFVYDNPEGDDIEMQNGGIEMEYGDGTIKVKDAEIPHFCKFGVKRGTSD